MLEQPFGRDQHPAVAQCQTLLDRPGAEGRKEWAEHADLFECAQHGDIEFWDPSGQHEEAVSLFHPQSAQHVGKAVALFCQAGIGEIAHLALFAEPAQGQMVATGAVGMAVDRFIGDVEPLPAGQPCQRPMDLCPVKGATALRIVDKIGGYLQRSE